MTRASDPNFEILREKLQEQIKNNAEFVASGTCDTHADYKFSVGVIEGLKTAERELLDLDKKLYLSE